MSAVTPESIGDGIVDITRSRLTRRRLILAAGGTVSATLLSACSPDDADSTSTPAVEASPTPLPAISFENSVDSSSLEILQTEVLNAFGHYDDIRTSEAGVSHLIPLEAIDWGGVAKDGIPSIDLPGYVGPDRWPQMAYDPDGLVIGVEVNGKHRAYPLQVLIWHEIVNETFDGKHLLVTY